MRPKIGDILLRCSALIGLWLSFIPAHTQGSKAIKICLRDEAEFHILNEPGTEGGPFPGVYIDILKELSNELDFKYKIIRFPYVRCMKYLQAGISDAYMAISYNKDREKLYAYPPKQEQLPDPKYAVDLSGFYFYGKKDISIPWNGNLDSMKNLTIGAIKNFSIVKWLRKRGIKVDESRDYETLSRKLKLGRIQAIAGHLETGKRLDTPVTIHQPPIAPLKPYFMVFSNSFIERRPQLAQKVWEAIHQMQKNKGIENIVNRYKDKSGF
ncbi:substrate-binding periplasmic protein [Pseudobacteriovorax antillogorgiicola]|uniref:Extracellular solute-binding protein, family 3 n=1 Tax=Pseudobacteriovorax antillogorgiicola TaxID=1513793 RepID=A0A1Y6BJD3_9BACT|nr:transporter substrate-binding domain-containing protein [Pseudobacteriovorax antillogorgiicola]TCS55375.1 extracellular solute-binding protein (family 3) [Pseudobacteriovorax antillogorgiicola]SMF13377.1 extracellular solute-binding protein, family 3 [Pseudobacteriovorax antillogorgiicola]